MSSQTFSQQPPSVQFSPSGLSPELLPETASGTVSGGDSLPLDATTYAVTQEIDVNGIEERLDKIIRQLDSLSAYGAFNNWNVAESLIDMEMDGNYGYVPYYSDINALHRQTTPGEVNLDYGVLLTFFFAAFMGGFLLTSLSRVCAFGVRCIKKLFAKI